MSDSRDRWPLRGMPHHNIHPDLRIFSGGEPSAPYILEQIQGFDRDVEAATLDVPLSQSRSHAEQPYRQRLRTASNGRNPRQRSSSHRSAPLQSTWVGQTGHIPHSQEWVEPRPKRRRQAATSASSQHLSEQHSSQQYYSDSQPGGPGWRTNNRFASLDDYPRPASSEHLDDGRTPDNGSANVEMMDVDYPYASPLQREPWYDRHAGNNVERNWLASPDPDFMSSGTGRNALNRRVEPMNVSGGLVNVRPSESIGLWNQGPYVPGDRNRPMQLLPLTSGSDTRQTVTPSASGLTMSCEYCNKEFDKEHKLNHHLRWHNRPFQCHLCPKAFCAAKDLRRHHKVHVKEVHHLTCNTLGCKYNHKSFQREDHLRRHIANVHRGSLLSPPDSNSLAD